MDGCVVSDNTYRIPIGSFLKGECHDVGISSIEVGVGVNQVGKGGHNLGDGSVPGGRFRLHFTPCSWGPPAGHVWVPYV